jgi:hypothetical protein
MESKADGAPKRIERDKGEGYNTAIILQEKTNNKVSIEYFNSNPAFRNLQFAIKNGMCPYFN